MGYTIQATKCRQLFLHTVFNSSLLERLETKRSIDDG